MRGSPRTNNTSFARWPTSSTSRMPPTSPPKCGRRRPPGYNFALRRRDARVAEGGALLRRYTAFKPYRGFESLSLRQFCRRQGPSPWRFSWCLHLATVCKQNCCWNNQLHRFTVVFPQQQSFALEPMGGNRVSETAGKDWIDAQASADEALEIAKRLAAVQRAHTHLTMML